MKELREKLKATAESQLDQMIQQVMSATTKIVTGTAVGSEELGRVALGGRTDNLRKKIISGMVRQAGDDLLEQYMDQQDLPLDKPGKGK